MKRDMHLIRRLVLLFETVAPGTESDSLEIDVDTDVIDYHLRLMGEAGLIEISTMRSGVVFRRMTWAGHDFADACRDEVLWKRTMRTIADKATSVTFDVLLHLLKGTLTAALLA